MVGGVGVGELYRVWVEELGGFVLSVEFWGKEKGKRYFEEMGEYLGGGCR